MLETGSAAGFDEERVESTVAIYPEQVRPLLVCLIRIDTSDFEVRLVRRHQLRVPEQRRIIGHNARRQRAVNIPDPNVALSKGAGLRIGISASAVRSHTNQLDRLFRKDIEHIEIGLFESLEVADRFAARARARDKTVGIHSPLVQGGSKYDLLRDVQMPTEAAWMQIQQEMDWCIRAKIDYLLVHYPYASVSGDLDLPAVDNGIQKLSRLQRLTDIRVICEPKLGDDHDPAGIGWLRNAPTRIFSDAGLHICWDVGDHLLASRLEEVYFAQFTRWKHLISIVHLHNVRMEGRNYRWTPPHPMRSAMDAEYNLSRIVDQLPRHAAAVFEYTPQHVATPVAIKTSFNFVKALTEKDGNA
ncbi:MAG: hypothetical protein CL902_07130 [Dehalococcoidia bacterium]|nr:hypothetical protein [Dehalococcoidia bacterium]